MAHVICASTQPSDSPDFCPDAKHATSPFGWRNSYSCMAQPFNNLWPYPKSTEFMSTTKSKKHLDLTGLHVEIPSMKNFDVKTSMRKVILHQGFHRLQLSLKPFLRTSRHGLRLRFCLNQERLTNGPFETWKNALGPQGNRRKNTRI